MDKQLKLSIIMPVYNVEQYIAESIKSVLAQTYKNWELLCVDDGSKDESVSIIKKYAINDSRIILLQKNNGGVSSARNYGIEHASGEYIAFLDADDLALPEMYETMIDLMNKEESDCVFCSFTRFFLSGKQITTFETSFDALKENPHDIKYFFYSIPAKMDGNNLITADIHGSCCRSIFKRKLIQENKIRFVEGIRFAEDQLFVIEYLYRCNKINYIDKPLLLYRAQTKKWVYHNLYESNILLLKHQINLLQKNDFYSYKEKCKIQAYLQYSTYMMIINEDLMFKHNAAEIIASYGKEFNRLLTCRGFIEKMNVNFDIRKVILFILLKLHLYRLVQYLFPNKRY